MQESLQIEVSPTPIVVGLISGTSADGVDAACCRLETPLERGMRLDILGTASRSYPPDVAASLLSPDRLTTPELARLDVEIGAVFAEAALAAASSGGIPVRDVDLIASHGQTVWHDPRGEIGGAPTTLQIGRSAEIASRTGCAVWSDFRAADVAAGGEGAPFVPYFDWLRFTAPGRWTVCLNLGGIANVTILPPAATLDDVVAFDTGPANIVIDALAQALLGVGFDADGSVASTGEVEGERLALALSDPYFDRPAPKSTGREAFGRPFVERHFAPLDGLSETEVADRLATAVALTVESVARAIESTGGAPPVPPDAEILVSGGGRKNRAVMDGLTERCAPRAVVPIDGRGVDGDFKEAIAFAVLGCASALGVAVNVPGATGARRAVRCGTWTPAPGSAR